MQESKITNIDIDEYVKQFRPELIDVTYSWATVRRFSLTLLSTAYTTTYHLCLMSDEVTQRVCVYGDLGC
jgi:hypothetical protein